MSLILGIETSCDECSASVVEWGDPLFAPHVLSLATFSQIQIHQPYGGVVPEVASRNHLETIQPIIAQALEEANVLPQNLDAIAVTTRPGLIGALLVGVSAAKAMAYALDLPLIPIHHLEGHASSLFLSQDAHQKALSLPFPLLLAVISGGHTNLYLVQHPPEKWPIDFLTQGLVAHSRDDAAGEAFDKIAKLLGFPYPGGKWIDHYAEQGNPDAFDLPRPLAQTHSTPDFSFSGLKTAVSLLIQELKKKEKFETSRYDLCASAQKAILDTLLNKISLAIRSHSAQSLAIVGGVSANRELRNRLSQAWRTEPFQPLQVPPFFPPLLYSTDNAAMIAAAGGFRLSQGQVLSFEEKLTLNAFAY